MAVEEVIVWLIRAAAFGILAWCALVLSRSTPPKE